MREINSPAEFAELMKECIAKVKWYVDKVNEKCGLFLSYPRVEFSLQGTTAGMAYILGNKIKFSPTLLRENPDDFLTQTAGHEVAHLAAMTKYGITIPPHGPEWQQVMHQLGLPPKRCHNYDVKNVPTLVGRIRNKRSVVKINNLTVKNVGVGQVIDFD